MSLDKIYFRDYKEKEDNTNYFLDCTRIQGSKELTARNDWENFDSVEQQIKEISNNLKEKDTKEIILVDDVGFSGDVLRNIILRFKQYGIKVKGIRSCISTQQSYEYFNSNLEKGLKCGCLLGMDVIDQICERDFYFGIAQSGISVIDPNGEIKKSPYFKPFGDAVKRASIPKEYENLFSNGCLIRSIYLWKLIEEKTGQKIYIKDMPEKILNTNQNERIIDVLRKGLIYYEEKDTNRDNGFSR